MTDTADRRRAAEARHGPGIAVRKRIDAMKAATDDWYTNCRRCGKQRVGSLAQLKQPCGCAEPLCE